MRQENQGGAWRAWAMGMILGVALVVALPAMASSQPGALMLNAAGAESGAQTEDTRGLPQKPEGLDDASWASLKKAIRDSAHQTKLSLEGSIPGDDGAEGDLFGISIAVSGDTALVGASHDDVGGNLDQGSAYVFTRSGNTWTQQAKLVAGDGAWSDGFGNSVALYGDTALVGAHQDDAGANENQGSAYVFTRSGADWTQQAKLVAADGVADEEFGRSVALSGDTALVGVPRDTLGANFAQGSAYVYTRSGTTWTHQAKLAVGNGMAIDVFGRSVALSGDTALVGVPGDDVGANVDQGSAYVFTRSGTTWTQQAQLLAGDGAVNDQFGYSVALSGDIALVGAILDDVGANGDQGSAYVFTRSGSTWTQQAHLVADDGVARGYFADSVAISGDTALVGSVWDNVGANIRQGSAYVYTRLGTTWTLEQKLWASDGAADDLFGSSVALSGDTALIGALGDEVGANLSQGSAYAHTRLGTKWTQQAKLVTGDGAANDQFGASVALFEDTVLVGLRYADVGANEDQGSAYVFTRSGTTWTQQAQLVAVDGAEFDQFGTSVALFGDTALVGASQDDVGANSDQGSAYVFTRLGTTWMQQAKLVAVDGATIDQFGTSVALSEDTALVGVRFDNVGTNINQGSAHVFTRSGRRWLQQAKLVADDGAVNDQFGSSVALSGDTSLVGASLDNVRDTIDQGSAYVFTRSGATWVQQARLLAGDGAMNDRFGSSVALSGETALVGAYTDDVGGTVDQGSAYVFARSGTTWSQQAQLLAGDGAMNDQFGYSVAISGDTALMGSSLDDVGANVNQGSVLVFARSGTMWTQKAQLVAVDGAVNDQFGHSVALSGGNVLVGAPSDDGVVPFGNPDEGAAYVFSSEREVPIFQDGLEPAP